METISHNTIETSKVPTVRTDKCLYVHKDKTTNQIFYVGIGTISRAHSKGGRNREWHKYVKDNNGYKIEILHKNLTVTNAKLMEKSMIAEIGRRHLGTGYLINILAGGQCHERNEEAVYLHMPDKIRWVIDHIKELEDGGKILSQWEIYSVCQFGKIV